MMVYQTRLDSFQNWPFSGQLGVLDFRDTGLRSWIHIKENLDPDLR
jgi:hypothetical protein